MYLSRATLQALARAEIDDAQLLLRHERVSNAYYLAGYALELGPKAAAARQFLAECLPDRAMVNDLYGHDLGRLSKLAGLERDRRDTAAADPLFAANWSTASQWSVASRYEMIDKFRAEEMVSAVADPAHGVMRWLANHW